MSRVFALCLLCSLLTLLAGSLSAEDTSGAIEGTVLDPTRRPLPRARVRLLTPAGAEGAWVWTDPQGRFRFTELTEADYRIRVELMGFESLERTVAAGREVELVLSLAPVEERVVVSATRTEAPTGQVGASTALLSGDELVRRQVLPISDGLRSVVGTSVARSGGMGSTTSLFVRGGESDYNKVFLDGIPLNEPGGFFDFSNLMTENIERVEVVRGPQSALFGSDAMTSVVQLFTRPGQAETYRPQFNLSLLGGNHHTWQARGGLGGTASGVDYSVGWARVSTDNREPNSSFHNSSLSARLGWELTPRTTVRLIGRGELGRVGTPGQTAFARPDSDSFLRRRDGSLGVSVHHHTTRWWEQHLAYSFQQSRQVSRNLFEDPPFTPRFEGRTAPFAFSDFTFDFLSHLRRHHLSFQNDWRLGTVGRGAGQHLLTFAVEWDRELGFFGDRLFPGAEVDAKRDNLGWVFQHQVLWGRLFLTNGFRIEDNHSFGTAVVPRSSLAYWLRTGSGGWGATKLKFNFGLGIKEPSLLESFSLGPFALGNPELAPERVRSFDLGVEQRFWFDRGKVELNWFDNRFRDLIGFEITSFVPFFGSFFNLGRTKAKGAEAVFELAPVRSLRGRGSYTFLDSQVTQSGTVFDPVFAEGNRLLRRPKHAGSFELLWDWRRLTVSSTLLVVGRRADSDFSLLGLTVNPGYTRWDLAWSYRSSYRVTYFGVVENLLNRDTMEVLGFPALKLSFRAGARLEF